jgi:putative ABC transport system permease protein
MDAIASDIWQALRLVRKAPGFTAVAIGTLALGIGANTAVFSAVDALLLRALPYADPDGVVMVWEDDPVAGYRRNTPAPGNYTDWARMQRSFAGIAATRGNTVNLTGDGAPEQLIGRLVTPNFFPVLGVQPIIGRNFTEEENATSAPVVLISYGLWQRRFGGDPAITGRTILLNDARREVIGVLPREFVFRNPLVDYWAPISFPPAMAADHGSHFLNVVARLAPGVSVDAADADMKRIAAELGEQFPRSNSRVSAVVVPVKEDLLGNARVELLVLMAASAAVLLIACANLASLLLSRAIGRRGELAIRAALGATRGWLVRQMLVEGLVLSVAGGALGLVIAPAGVGLLAQMAPRGFPAATSSIVDPRVLAFTLAVATMTGVLFSLVPALQAARASLGDTLQQQSRGAGGGRSGFTRDALVVAQVAIALVLLVGAGLMLRTLANLRALEIGFQSDHLLTLRTTLPASRYDTPAKRVDFFDRVLPQVEALPNVRHAGYGSTLPFAETGNSTWFQIEGLSLPPNDPGDVLFRGCSNDYLQTLGVRVVEGRLFDDRDGRDGMPTVIVNETFARTYWPGASALGHRVRFQPNGRYLTIVGVVRDLRERGYTLSLKSGVYLPLGEAVRTWAQPETLVVRAAGNPVALAETIRRIVDGVDPNQPVSAVRTMDEIIDAGVADRRQQMTLLTSFSTLALLLASIGLYGVLSYAVSQRSRELGLRMALGATPLSVVRLIISRGVALTGAGLCIGVAMAWAGTRAMNNLLYGIRATDAATFAAVAGLLTLVSMAACGLPALRASRVDPIIVLRLE